MLKQGQLTDPLDPDDNSLKNHKQINRHFYIFNPWKWKYKPYAHSFELSKWIWEIKVSKEHLFDMSNFIEHVVDTIPIK